MNIMAQERSLKAKLRTLNKQAGVVERELDTIQKIKSGDKPSHEQARRIKTQRYSYTVHFQRRKVLRNVRSPGEVCKSLRRFGTEKEAVQHGKRFTRIRDHRSFEVVRVAKRANAWINWRTGKTNPVIG